MGEIHREDFLKWQSNQQYDIVASFGFIEHFEDPVPVVDRHFRPARLGGYVVITVPNFARGQKALHWLFDRKNLRLYNTRCMNLEFFRAAARRNNIGFWRYAIRAGSRTFGWAEIASCRGWGMRVMWRTMSLLERMSKSLPKGVNPRFSPFIVAVYQT